ncbi:MAG TPA: DDE-type integrase/transposase/recombinase [Segeticoccus sp.]|uniref:DDE-type integrase/transposase/recombinase n=1 Tax=Segeticoccus sp. TaxID=2706531 RepID=UPI002D80F142|nr:DDE-type integrase/transposase/recombinase [Segeticoccus sp.]HET8599830.1 DDE-type integrase/transposase/recombinase [Segeticoccus sp.]
MGTSNADREEQVRAERARAVGLFRYTLIREPADEGLSTKARGRLVRELAAREHPGPFGQPVQVSRETIDRWIRTWRRGGFDALVPAPRRVSPRTPADVLDLAVALKREVPARTAAQVATILRSHCGWAPNERTLQRHFAKLELNTRPDGNPPQAFGRFEAEAPNVRWTGDALHGPTVGGRKAILCAFIDDHSRLLTGYRWARREDTVRLEAALHAGLASRGIPASIYLDNGAAMVDKQLARACASLGIHLVHSRPGKPAGRGKIERFFRTVREQFLVEIGSGRELEDMTQLNSLFTAWTETVYHRRVHSETGQAPIERWSAGQAPTMPTRAQLREAFLWAEYRTVTKTATVGLHGNHYEVDAALIGRRVELVFDPFDLTRIQVRWQGRPMGDAIPHRIGRHVHAKARPDETTPPPATKTGIDYLHLIQAAHTAKLADKTCYSRLDSPPEQVPGQLPLPGSDIDDDGGQEARG